MIRDDSPSRRARPPLARAASPGKKSAPPTPTNAASPAATDAGSRRTPVPRASPREPIYLASQLASICDVDLKTIHNWCDRNDDPDAPAGLEAFRTPGGHLRFRHSSVVRFLNRWGYPIPEALMRDRPHLLLIEPDERQRAKLIAQLRLVRPGDDDERTEEDTPVAAKKKAEGAGATLGLFANARWYVHATDDPYRALINVGERIGSGAPLDLAVVSVPMATLEAREWVRAVRERTAGSGLRFVLVTAEDDAQTAREPGIIARIQRNRTESLRTVLEDASAQWAASAIERLSNARPPPGTRKRRTAIEPREPIYVASQVATIWDVDLKTVHNWVERGDIEAFRTPGRHLRFRRRSLLHFLRRYNMAIPDELAPPRPRVFVVDPDARAAKKVAALLGEPMQVTTFQDAAAALIELGAQCTGANLIDAIVATLPIEGIDDRRWLSAVVSHPETRYTRVVVISNDDSKRRDWQDLGGIATVQRNAIEQVPTVLEKALGLSH